jgi:hypothetical protein
MTVSMDKKYVTRDGKCDAKVLFIHRTGTHPVVVAFMDKDTGHNYTGRRKLSGELFSNVDQHPHDLIEVPEEKPSEWIKFDAENGEVPSLSMHDLIQVKHKSGHQSPTLHAWAVDFDNRRNPVVAYRIIEKAEQPENKPAPTIEVFVDVAEAAERKVLYGNYGLQRHQVASTAREAAVRAVLKLAGVKV